MPQHKSGRGGTKKFGRNEAKCKSYRLNRSRPNKLRKLTRHLKIHADDLCGQAALRKAKAVA